MRRITWLIALVLAAGALTAAGCGGDDSSSGSSGGTGTSSSTSTPSPGSGSSGGGETLTVTADPTGQIKWDKTSLKAKAGSVTLKLVNDSSVPHAIEVEGNGVEEETKIVSKANADVTVDLKPGTYEYYCPVGNHRQLGMKGTLTVS